MDFRSVIEYALDWVIDRMCILRHGKNLDELMWGDP